MFYARTTRDSQLQISVLLQLSEFLVLLQNEIALADNSRTPALGLVCLGLDRSKVTAVKNLMNHRSQRSIEPLQAPSDHPMMLLGPCCR